MNTFFAFKGKRNYLHATSLMDHIVKNVLPSDTGLRDIDFSMSKFTDRVCDIVPADEIKGQDNAVIGQFSCGEKKLLIVESEDRITRRVEYPEEDIVDNCLEYGEKTIIIPTGLDHFSFIEKTVAAYKALLEQLFSKTYHSFFFIRIVLAEIPEGQVEITFDRVISKKYFQATITRQGSRVGTIFFGAKQ